MNRMRIIVSGDYGTVIVFADLGINVNHVGKFMVDAVISGYATFKIKARTAFAARINAGISMNVNRLRVIRFMGSAKVELVGSGKMSSEIEAKRNRARAHVDIDHVGEFVGRTVERGRFVGVAVMCGRRAARSEANLSDERNHVRKLVRSAARGSGAAITVVSAGCTGLDGATATSNIDHVRQAMLLAVDSARFIGVVEASVASAAGFDAKEAGDFNRVERFMRGTEHGGAAREAVMGEPRAVRAGAEGHFRKIILKGFRDQNRFDAVI